MRARRPTHGVRPRAQPTRDGGELLASLDDANRRSGGRGDKEHRHDFGRHSPESADPVDPEGIDAGQREVDQFVDTVDVPPSGPPLANPEVTLPDMADAQHKQEASADPQWIPDSLAVAQQPLPEFQQHPLPASP